MRKNNILEMATMFANAAEDREDLAVCVCALKDDKVLAVARRGTTDEWGLPGGKVEVHEDPKDAIVREVQEEAQISINKELLTPVFTRNDADGFFVITYLYQENITEVPEQGDAGPARWVTWDDLLKGPFGEYNARLKSTLGI